MSRRFLVVGLRGGSWKVFKPSIARGEMPSLGRLLQSGSHGDLQAFVPTYLLPNWASVWTGVHPGRHMIFASAALAPRRVRTRRASLNELPIPTWLELASEADVESVSVYAPLTHPPPAIRGSVVSDRQTPGSVYPPPLLEDLRHRFPEFPVDVDATHFPDGGLTNAAEINAYLDLHLRALTHTRELSVELIGRGNPELVVVDFFSLDRVLHALWAGIDEPIDENATRGIERYLRGLDIELGALISYYQPSAVLAFSEHGMMRCSRLFRLAPALLAAGILEPRPQSRSRLGRLGKTRPLRVLRRVRQRLAPAAPRQPWRLSMSPDSVVYLDDKAIYVRGNRTAATGVAVALEAAQDPQSGIHPVARAWDAVDLYGSLDGQWHVLALEQNAGYTLRTGKLGQSVFESVVAGRDYLAGTHTATGFWLLAGRGVETGREVEVKVTDLAPTILSYLGLSVPTAMLGDPANLIGGARG